MKNNKSLVLLFCFLFLFGCAALQEDAKILWGSSTKALEEERPQAARMAFSCSIVECFDAVVKFAEAETTVSVENFETASTHTAKVKPESAFSPGKPKNFDIFIKDRKKNIIVIMGIPTHVNTTEVGIFFTSVPGGTLVEMTSLSSSAKIKASGMLFPYLSGNFKEIGL